MSMINDENGNQTPDVGNQAALTSESEVEGEGYNQEQSLTPEQRRGIIIMVVVIIILLASVVAGVVALAVAPAHVAAQIRDIAIIMLAIQSLMIGLVLVVLIVQLARLINLLNNEIKPILDSTNETVSHLRGTTVFLSENLAEPVIKLNEYLAGIMQLFTVTGLNRKSSKKKKNTTKGE